MMYHTTDQYTQTERLIKAINDLAAEVIETRKHREKLLAKVPKADPNVRPDIVTDRIWQFSRTQPVLKGASCYEPQQMSKGYIEGAVRDLQITLGHPATGILTKADELALANQGLTYGIIIDHR